MNTTIKNGTILLITCNEYSDYGVVALVQANGDICPEAVCAAYPGKRGWDFEAGDFGDWLIKKKFVKRLKFQELHTDKYFAKPPIPCIEPEPHSIVNLLKGTKGIKKDIKIEWVEDGLLPRK